MEKHLSLTNYLFTYVALIALAALSLGLSFIRWGDGDLVVGLGIASIKAFLVFWIFMHLIEQQFANRLFMLISILLFILLVSLTAVDVASRHTFPRGLTPTQTNSLYR
jgi:caa(3)-type oxidase subunit IV